MVRAISKSRDILRAGIVVVFFMIIGIILILIGIFSQISSPASYTSYMFNRLYFLPIGASITFLAIICGLVVTYRKKIISNMDIIIFVIFFIIGIIIYSVGHILYVNGMEYWWFTPPYPDIAPLPDTVKIAVILLVIAVLEIISVTLALIYAVRKK